MLINLLYKDSGTIKEKTLGSWKLDSQGQLDGIYFGQYAKDIQTADDNKANAIVIQSLPTYSAEVILHFIPEEGDDPNYSDTNFTVYAVPKILEDGNTSVTFTHVALHKGTLSAAPTDIAEDNTASNVTDHTVTADEANVDPASDPSSTSWLDVANKANPYAVFQLEIKDTQLSSLESQFYFAVVFES